MPVKNRNKQGVAGLEHGREVGRAPEQRERGVIDMGDIDLTGVGGQPTAEWVQAVALARRVETHVLVALQQGRGLQGWHGATTTAAARGVGNERQNKAGPALAPARGGWGRDGAATRCLQ